MPKAQAMQTIFIADDHKLVRDGLRLMFERAGGFDVVGEAADGRTLVEEALRLNPEIVITDLGMNELNGLEAVRQLRSSGYRGIVVMLSMHDERRSISEALASGVNAYVHKDLAFEQLVAAIAAARCGERWLSPQLKSLADGNSVPTLAELLTKRELEVLQLFAEGAGTKEVAARLHLSPKTVEVFRLKLFAKLKVNNVIELTRIAIKEGLIWL